MNYYRVTVTHDDLDGELVMDLAATDETAASLRARHTAMHHYRHAELLHANAVVAPITAAEFEAANA